MDFDKYHFSQKTPTVGQLIDELTKLGNAHGFDKPVRVNTSYDQGQRGMAITRVAFDQEDPALEVYVGIDA